MNFLFLLNALFFSSIAIGQNNSLNPKYENWYKNNRFETDEMIVEIVDANAQSNICKLKIKITNKTADYLIYKPTETEFIFSFGTFNPNGNYELIKPKDNESKVLTIKGDTRFQVESFNIHFKGFYRISEKGITQNTPNFKLPAATNNFETGPFKVSLNSISKETKQTSVQFKLIYSNDQKHFGLINLGKAVLKIESGQEFAMDNQNDKQILLGDGEDKKISYDFRIPGKILDMQFANMELVWKNTFLESEAIALKINPIVMTIDPGLTGGKNK